MPVLHSTSPEACYTSTKMGVQPIRRADGQHTAKIEYSLHNEHHMLTLHITIKARSMLATKMAPGGSGTLPDSQHRRPSKGAGHEFLMRDRARNKGCSREEIQRMYNQYARARKLQLPDSKSLSVA